MEDLFIPKSFTLLVNEDLVVAYKRAQQPTVPLFTGQQGSLLEEIGRLHPEILQGFGKKECEGLALHRLDTNTSGLVAFARDMDSYQKYIDWQKHDMFVKVYYAETQAMKPTGQGWMDFTGDGRTIVSAFRAYGPKRKLVRPCKEGRLYATGLSWMDSKSCTATITQGFRHQIRVHLAWSGHPIAGDKDYGVENGVMKLCCISLHSPDFNIDLNNSEEIDERS